MDHPPAPSIRRIAIYTSRPDSPWAANQLAAIQRYAGAMGWVTVAIVESDEQRLLDLAAAHALDLVLCWRTSDLRRAESVVQRLSAHRIELLAVAQSCSALME
jgi:DNA invertase Pin-like site-specific DNA recombinase